MIIDRYPPAKMMSMLNNPDFTEDLGRLVRDQKRQETPTDVISTDLEKELNIFRSGSAPPTVEGSLSSIGGLFNSSGMSNIVEGGAKDGFLSEEELRVDPAYVNYYYSKLASGNLNPRLPPPLVSREDWRFAQKLQGGNGNRSLFAVQPGFGGDEQDNAGGGGDGSGADWEGDGLIGLSGLGELGSSQKSLAEIIQDNMNQANTAPRHPSRPASCNLFDEGIETSEAQYANLLCDLTPADGLVSGANKHGISSNQNFGSLSTQTYASALGASLSRSTTPEPQLTARNTTPRIPTVGGGRSSSMDIRSVDTPSTFNDIGSNTFNGASANLSESEELVAALSGMNLSTDGAMDGANYLRSQTKHVDIRKSANSYVRGPSMPTLNGAGSPHLQTANKRNHPFPNYGCAGFATNPSSAPVMDGHLGSSNLPPLFENAVAASAMGGAVFDSTAMAGGLTLGPNLMAAGLQNFVRLGNQNAGNSLQAPLLDPLSLQYLRANEIVAAQVAALNNEVTVDRDYISNSYVDLQGLQEAYLEAFLSSQKSQFAVPYLGKSGSLNHNYYGSPAYGLGMAYPGGPMVGSLFPNSLVGSGSPVLHGERNMLFSSGLRNLSGGAMGAWHSETGSNLDGSFASSLLDEFKSNKTKCFELSEIVGHVVEFSSDQYGSRFIQQKLETATMDEKDIVFHEVMPQALSLMTDVFGNYVIQKFFEHGSSSQIRELADQLIGHVLALSLQMYGCRVIQKAIEVVKLDQQILMVKELDGHVMRCVHDQNGNHVIQKCIECVPEEAIQFIVSTVYDQVVTLATHPYGCRVIQRVLEHCHDAKTQQIMMDEIMQSVCMLAQDQYGNYVVQHVLEHGEPHERSAIITKLTGQIVQMSQQKFASNVIEKCLTFGTPAERQMLVNEMLGSTDENDPLQVMMKDQFANYVVQKVLETCDDQQLELILNRIKVHLNALKKYTYGKHIVARVEKLVAAGERRISILTPHPAQMA
ncbi:hypothetical protein SLE2022_108690 [Rubroshorea leprosula]